MLNSILEMAVILFVVATLLFWGLFFFVVQVRLGDASAKVEDDGFRFLRDRWPTKELDAYRALLEATELKRWYNLYLLIWARRAVVGLGCVVLACIVAQ